MLGIPTGGKENITPAFQYNSFLNAFFVQDDWKIKAKLDDQRGRPLRARASRERKPEPHDEWLQSLCYQRSIPPRQRQTTRRSKLAAACRLVPAYWRRNLRLIRATVIRTMWRPSMSARASASHGRRTSRMAKASSVSALASTTIHMTTTTQARPTAIPPPPPSCSPATTASPTTRLTTLSRPDPPNPIQQPTGNTLGVNANLGAKMVYYSPSIKVPYSERSSLDVQYQIGNTILVDLGYINNHQVHLSYSNTVDAIPLLPYLSRSPYYDVAANQPADGSHLQKRRSRRPPTSPTPSKAFRE